MERGADGDAQREVEPVAAGKDDGAVVLGRVACNGQHDGGDEGFAEAPLGRRAFERPDEHLADEGDEGAEEALDCVQD